MREFLRVAQRVETDFANPLPCPRIAFLARYAGALQAEGDIVEHGAIVKRSVVLKDHAAVGSRTFYGFAHHLYCSGGRWKLRTQAGDKTQDGGLAGPRGSQ